MAQHLEKKGGRALLGHGTAGANARMHRGWEGGGEERNLRGGECESESSVQDSDSGQAPCLRERGALLAS